MNIQPPFGYKWVRHCSNCIGYCFPESYIYCPFCKNKLTLNIESELIYE
jgi:hypothetical protein